MSEATATRPKWAVWAMRAVVAVGIGVVGVPLFATLSNAIPPTPVWNVLTAVAAAFFVFGLLSAVIALFQFFASRRA